MEATLDGRRPGVAAHLAETLHDSQRALNQDTALCALGSSNGDVAQRGWEEERRGLDECVDGGGERGERPSHTRDGQVLLDLAPPGGRQRLGSRDEETNVSLPGVDVISVVRT